MRISDWSSDVCSSDLERRIDSEIADVEDTSADIDGRIVAHLHRRIRRRPFIEEEAIAMVEVGAQQTLPHIPALRRLLGANVVSTAGHIGEFLVARSGTALPRCLNYWSALELRVIGRA